MLRDLTRESRALEIGKGVTRWLLGQHLGNDGKARSEVGLGFCRRYQVARGSRRASQAGATPTSRARVPTAAITSALPGRASAGGPGLFFGNR